MKRYKKRKKSPLKIIAPAVILAAIAVGVLIRLTLRTAQSEPPFMDNSLPPVITGDYDIDDFYNIYTDTLGNFNNSGSAENAENAENSDNVNIPPNDETPDNMGSTDNSDNVEAARNNGTPGDPETAPNASAYPNSAENTEAVREISVKAAEAIASDSAEAASDNDEAPPDITNPIDVNEAVIPAGGEPEEMYEGENGEIIPITDISLTFYEAILNIGDTKMPRVTMYPENAPDKSEIWESSDSGIAEVDEIGNITAVSPGECVVTVRSRLCPEVSAEVRVRVKPPVTEPTYISGILIANKSYPLPRDYNPGVDPEARQAFDEMQEAAAAEGLNIYISSGFRSYDYQSGLYERYVKKSGKAEADRYSARPGYSEHQSGLAFDLNSIDMTFEDTPEYEWVKANCVSYGFIIRYPKDGEAATGYMYEPWHIRYLGRETARQVSDSGLTLEEYLGIDSKYDE